RVSLRRNRPHGNLRLPLALFQGGHVAVDVRGRSWTRLPVAARLRNKINSSPLLRPRPTTPSACWTLLASSLPGLQGRTSSRVIQPPKLWPIIFPVLTPR